MQELMLSVARGTGLLARVALWLSAAALTLMTALITAQVFYRYVLNDSISWSEPASVMLMGWFIFLGAAVGIREGYHLSFDVVLYFIPRKLKLWLYSISDVVVLGFSCGMIYYGAMLAEKTMNNRLPSLGISGAFDFLPLVFGGVLLLLFTIERLARRAAGLHTPRFGDTEEEA